MPRISSTTWPAGPSDEPDPSTSAPRSLMTSLAPWLANSRACSRPMPRPAPEMPTTRPSQIPTFSSSFAVVSSLVCQSRWSGRLRCRPVLLSQLPLEDLPSILPRQLRHEVDAAGALEMGQVIPAEGHELGAQLFGARHPLGRLYHGLHRLAPLVVGHPDGGDVTHRRVFEQHGVHLGRVDVDPAGDDEVGGAVGEVQEALL